MIATITKTSSTLAVLATAFLALSDTGVNASRRVHPRQAPSSSTTITAAAAASTSVAQPATASSVQSAVPTASLDGSSPSAAGCGSFSGNFCPVFEDNFETFDLSKWKHEVTMAGGGNWEFQGYTNNRTNSFVKNGVLNIRPTFTSDIIGEDKVLDGGVIDLNGNENGVHCTDPSYYGCMRTSSAAENRIINPIQSARISTVNSANIRFGRVEVRAQLPVGDWLWPAIWMLPKDGQYGPWPASGEIDIMESRGNAAGQSVWPGHDQSSSALHWGPYWSANQYEKTVAEKKSASGTYADGFHTFGLEWTPEKITTYVDSPSNKVLEVPNTNWWAKSGLGTSAANPWEGSTCPSAPFDQEFYLVINLAVGGTSGFFKDAPGRPWRTGSPNAAKDFYLAKNQWGPTWSEKSTLKIDSVKIWKMC
ncbi:gram negative bacteria binding protein 1 [Phlyctochytrium arcticum]|nr:gram negative bacteria binding protein 1 [Phlyctochytrium arcticum]